MIVIVCLECISIWNLLIWAEQVQISKYETHAYKTFKTAHVRTIMLKHPTKQWKGIKNKIFFVLYCFAILNKNYDKDVATTTTSVKMTSS